jgi:hypothetical protein
MLYKAVGFASLALLIVCLIPVSYYNMRTHSLALPRTRNHRANEYVGAAGAAGNPSVGPSGVRRLSDCSAAYRPAHIAGPGLTSIGVRHG